MYRKGNKIPTLIVVFFFILGFSSVLYFDQSIRSFIFQTKQNIPVDVHFTNITDNSFTVSWVTNDKTTGTIEIYSHSSQKKIWDNLDSDNIPRERHTHHFTVSNLKADTKFSVKVIAGKNNACNNSSNCPSYVVKTSKKISSYLDLPPAKGVIVDKNGLSVPDAIVYLIADKSLPLSGRTDSAGIWVIPLNILRSNTDSKKSDLKDNETIQIISKVNEFETTTAVIDLKSIKQNLNIPDMKLGSSYNFIDLYAKKGLLASSLDQRVLGVKTQNNYSSYHFDSTTNQSLDNSQTQILFPKDDADFTPDTRPRIRGVGLPNQKLLITVNSSSPQTGVITVESDGTWSWRPPKTLEPGMHYLSLEGYDNHGKLYIVKRQFIVLKSGERVLGESTTSATLTPSPSPTIINTTLSPTLTMSPTVNPTISPTPSTILSVTPLPTAQPTVQPTLTSLPTPTVNTPRTGNTTSTIALIGGSLALLIIGSKLLLFP